MKKIIRIIFFVLITQWTFAQNTTYYWAGAFGGSGQDYANSVVEDAAGNVYVMGTAGIACDFDPGPLSYTLTCGPTGYYSYITKLDALGNFLWVKQIGINALTQGTGIKLDASGNIFGIGIFAGTGDFDPSAGVFNLSSTSGFGTYILKLDGSGNFIWAKQLSGTNDAKGRDFAFDALGNICIAGNFNGTVDFDPSPATYTIASSGNEDIFVTKLDVNGNFIWSKVILGPTSSADCAYSISVDGNNNIYTGGEFVGTIDFDPAPTSFTMEAPALDVFINKFDPNGNFIWAKQFGGNPTTGNYFGELTVDAVGNIFSTGYFNGVSDVDPGPAVLSYTPLGMDFYLNKLDALGNMVWTKQITGSSDGVGMSLCLDISGDIYLTGYFNNGIIDMDPGPGTASFTAASFNNALFINKYSSIGNYVWAKQLFGSGTGISSCVYTKSGSSIYTSGYFSNILDFDPGPGVSNLAAYGNNDGFIQKMNQCLVPTAPANITPTANVFCQGNSSTLTVSSSATVSWYANATGGSSLGSGTTFVTPTLSAGSYTYYAEAYTCTTSISRTAVTFSVSLCTAVYQSYLNEQMKVYPNPSNGLFTIDLQQSATIAVSNVLGKIIFQGTLSEGKNTIDLNEFDEHLFLLKLENDQGTRIVKLIKE